MNQGGEITIAMRKTIIQIVLLVAATWCAAQQGSIQREGNAWTSVSNGTLAGVHNLRIQLEAGGVEVEGGSAPGISYVIRNRSYEPSEERAREQLQAYKVSSYVRGDTAFIVGQWEGGRPHKFSSDLKVTVPRNLDLAKIETGGGVISVKGITGRVDGQSGGGAVSLDDIGGPIRIETGGGHIQVGNVSSDLNLRTGGGNIRIGSVKGRVAAETGGGNVLLASCGQGAHLQTGAGLVKVEKCVGEVRAETGGGNIELGEIGGQANVDTGGGTIKLTSATGPVKAETGGGSIELWGVPSAHVETGAGAITAKFIPGGDTDSILETGTGDVTVYLMASVKMTVNASIDAAGGHTITTDFPQIRVSSEGEGGEVSGEGSLNGGGPVLKIRTTMGSIYIRRAQ